MRWQTTAILAVILIALGAFFYVYEVRLGPEREKTEGRKGRVFTAEPADVTEVEIKRPDSVVKLKREGDGWQILEPVKARGDREENVRAIMPWILCRKTMAERPDFIRFWIDRALTYPYPIGLAGLSRQAGAIRSHDTLARLGEQMERRELAPGEALDASGRFGVVLAGMVRGQAGLLRPGDTFAESVTALTPARWSSE